MLAIYCSYAGFPPGSAYGGYNAAATAVPPPPAPQPWWHQTNTPSIPSPQPPPKRSTFRFRIGVQGVQNQQPRRAPNPFQPPSSGYANVNPPSQYSNSSSSAGHYHQSSPRPNASSYANSPIKRRKLNTFSSAPAPAPSPTPTTPAPAPAPAAKPAASGSSAFPPALQNYVVRAYKSCINDRDKQAVEGKLRQIITTAIQKKTINLTDWANHPLPVLPSATAPRRKRRRKEKSRWSSNDLPDTNASRATAEADRKEDLQRRRRQMRFHSPSHARSRYSTAHASPRAPSLEPIVGTCTALEKRYLRLTGLPDPTKIRPLHILKKSLAQLRRKWAAKECDYLYACEQFKSIRQDLTVQHLFGRFSVEVYEAHAHVALASKDMNEFNQCQTRLIDLYLQDWSDSEGGVPGHPMEFLAYRIL